jgi:hypothetical protein
MKAKLMRESLRSAGVSIGEAAKGMDKNYFFEIKKALACPVKVGGVFKKLLNLEFSQNRHGVPLIRCLC